MVLFEKWNSNIKIGVLVLTVMVSGNCKVVNPKAKNEASLKGGGGQSISALFGFSGSINESILSKSQTTGRAGTEQEAVRQIIFEDLTASESQKSRTVELGRQQFNNGEGIEKAKAGRAWMFVSASPTASLPGLDQLLWDEEAHLVREQTPYFWAFAENDRVVRKKSAPVDSTNPEHFEISLGTDYFTDFYYDTKNFSLESKEIVLRSRLRIDSPGVCRRVLLQSKIDSNDGQNQTNIKKVKKADYRWNTPNSAIDMIPTIDAAIKTGIFESTAIDPVVDIYAEIVNKSYTDVLEADKSLVIEPKIAIFSERARYHLNGVTTDRLSTMLGNFEAMNQLLTDSNVPEVNKLVASNADLQANNTEILAKMKQSASMLEIKALEAKAIKNSEVYHKIAKALESHYRKSNLWEGDSNKVNRIFTRKVETFGSIHLTAWMRAVQFALRISFATDDWNSFIDSFDYTRALPFEYVVANFTEDHLLWKTKMSAVDDQAVVFAVLSSDVQIELQNEQSLAVDRFPEGSDERHYAALVLEKVENFQHLMSSSRRDQIKKAVEAAFGKDAKFQWRSSETSKGLSSLRNHSSNRR